MSSFLTFLGKRRSKSGFKWWISGDITKQIIHLLLLEQLVHCYGLHWDIKTQKVTRIKVLLCDENSLRLCLQMPETCWYSVATEEENCSPPGVIVF